MTNKATIFWYLIFIIGFCESFAHNSVNNKFEDTEIRGEFNFILLPSSAIASKFYKNSDKLLISRKRLKKSLKSKNLFYNR